MGATGYLGHLRKYVGHDLLLIPAAAACIRDEEGRILLLRRSDGATERTCGASPAAQSSQVNGPMKQSHGRYTRKPD